MPIKNVFRPLALVLIVWLTSSLYPTSPPVVRLFGGVSHKAERLLKTEGVATAWEGQVLTIEIEWRESVVAALSTALYQNYLEAELCRENLANVNTTRGPRGEPYKRRLLRWEEDGTVSGIVKDLSDFNWSYDPSHPDAVKDGPKLGYVAYPNVSPAQEEAKLEGILLERANLKRALAAVDPNLVLNEPAVWLGDLPEREGPDWEPAREPISPSLEALKPAVPFKTKWIVRQRNGKDAGQASVATALNWLHRSAEVDAADVDRHYGFQLLHALKAESASLGLDWRDVGDLRPELWPELERWVQQERLPALLAFNGELSPSPRGHIVVLVEVDGERVTYVDPQDGKLKSVTREQLEKAERHPDGNFVFLALPFEQTYLDSIRLPLLFTGSRRP